MMTTPKTSQRAMLVGLLVFTTSAFAQTGSEIIRESGIKGGLIVHIGCGDAKLTSELTVNDSCIVQGLDKDKDAIQATRQKLLKQGGNISVSAFDGKHLPYVDNLVNLVVAEDLGDVTRAEVMRVLAPYGVAYIKHGQAWQKTVKPVPPDTDEWTHYLHDPDNNAVSHDQQVHPPKYLKWVGSPRYSRHHDHMSAVSACVTAGGKIYHTMDESSRLSIYLRPTWKLVGRDAYNGIILWKRDISEWYSHMQRLKSGPAYLPRKLVAIGDILYASLGIHEPLSVIDGATGTTLNTYVPDMETDEILYSDGVLFLLGSTKGKPNPAVDLRAIQGQESRRLVAVRADNGEILWEFNSKILPLSLTLGKGQVYVHDTKAIVALNSQTGKTLWRSEPLSYWKLMLSMFAPTLVTYKDVVFWAGGATFIPHRGSYDQMYAISAKTGKTLWTDEHPPSGYQSPEDILIVDDLVWCAATTSGNLSGELIGRDPWTGEEKKRFPSNVDTYWFHHRCYRAKATDNYFLMSRTGVEFVDYKKEDWLINHWVRGACLYGVMPANGSLYAPQHPCACYPEVKLNGFNALSSHIEPANTVPAQRLVKGPAFQSLATSHQPLATAHDWPTFRHDASRSGSTTADIPNALKKSWSLEIGGRLSQPVLADGRLFVAEVDRHTVHAIDESSGKKLWSFVAGARVDSPPTIYRGRVLFGSNDGWVYCLRASDGELAWKFLDAPRDMKHIAFEQIESVWPVPGNILIENDTAYFVAGRNIFLDGGLHIYRLNPLTGEMLSETVMTDIDPDGKPIQEYIDWLNMPVGRPDILSSNGKRVYMCSQPFDMQGKRTRINRLEVTDQRGEDAHLFCPSGFLDDSWWHRTYQVYGQSFSGGHSGYHRAGRETPSGKLMAFDDQYIYSFGRKPEYYKWTTPIEHQLFSVDKRWTLGTGESKTEQKAQNQAPDSMIRYENADSLDPVGKSLAVEAWVKPVGANASGVILARGGPSNGYALVLQRGKPKFIIRTDGYAHSVEATEKVRARWVHIAGVLTADKKLKLYINGELNSEGEKSGPISAMPLQATEIGADDAGSVGTYKTPSLFAGSIDDVRIYHGELSAREIMTHTRSESAVSAARAELVLHCTFNDGKAQDSSGKKNHGVLTKGVTPTKGQYGQALSFVGGPRPNRGRNTRTAFPYRWKQDLPLFVRALVKTPGKLIVAGPEDITEEEEVQALFTSPEMQVRLDRQSAILAGERGGILQMVSTKDGQKLSEYKLDVPPLFDGMIAANGKLFIACMDGSIVCLQGK
ncbi:MAG: PQQ-binding-like beta-propeller repeat protein [Phycisphaeraceae bacterium]|nr:PQQ-binding-like beta-propeller repeat protein [Phycisphaeraceae bacterium]